MQTLLENLILSNIQIKTSFNQHNNSRKLIQIIMQLVISDLGWFILFWVICRTQIRRFFLQRHLMATLSVFIKNNTNTNKKKAKQICKHLLGISYVFP